MTHVYSEVPNNVIEIFFEKIARINDGIVDITRNTRTVKSTFPFSTSVLALKKYLPLAESRPKLNTAIIK